MKIDWGEVVRVYREPGLFARAEKEIDPAIDLESAAARAALEDLVVPRIAAAAAASYDRVEIRVFADGERRHGCLFPPPAGAAGDPRAAHLVAAARRAGGRTAEDDDRFEWRLHFDETGRPRVVAQEVRFGRLSASAGERAAAAPLRERLDRLRASPPMDEILWRTPNRKTVLVPRARSALAAIAEVLPGLPAPLAAEAEALTAYLEDCARVAATPGARGPEADAPLADPAWLGLLAGRKGSLGRLAQALYCGACNEKYRGRSIVERRFDTRTAGLWGEAGVSFECPRGHEFARSVEESG